MSEYESGRSPSFSETYQDTFDTNTVLKLLHSYSYTFIGETACPGHFVPGESALDTHWTGAWMGPRTGLDYMK